MNNPNQILNMTHNLILQVILHCSKCMKLRCQWTTQVRTFYQPDKEILDAIETSLRMILCTHLFGW